MSLYPSLHSLGSLGWSSTPGFDSYTSPQASGQQHGAHHDQFGGLGAVLGAGGVMAGAAGLMGMGVVGGGIGAGGSGPAGGKAQGPPNANLFIYHIPTSWGDYELLANFSSFGAVMSASVFKDRNTGLSKGFGFVSYDSAQAAQLAIQVRKGKTASLITL
jgi:hypothetical protein